MTGLRLFEDGPRSDRRTRRSGENWFRFLDRVDDVYFSRVRDVLNAWFDRLPSNEKPGLRRRFQTSSEDIGDPAFFELFLNEALTRGGFELEYEPSLAATARRPDFLAQRERSRFFLEAKAVLESRERSVSERRHFAALESLRAIESRDFTLAVRVRREGTDSASMRRVRMEVERWLAGLDRTELLSHAGKNMRGLPRREFKTGSWEFEIGAIPRPDHRVGTRSHAGAVSISSGLRGWGESWDRLAAALREKALRYQDLGCPYVVAVLVGELFIDVEEIASALFGDVAASSESDGARSRRQRQPRMSLWGEGMNSRVSAVLVARHLVPNSINATIPTLWRNPEARYPLEPELPFAAEARRYADASIEIDEPLVTPADFFGLPPEWPGPELPFGRTQQAPFEPL